MANLTNQLVLLVSTYRVDVPVTATPFASSLTNCNMTAAFAS